MSKKLSTTRPYIEVLVSDGVTEYKDSTSVRAILALIVGDLSRTLLRVFWWFWGVAIAIVLIATIFHTESGFDTAVFFRNATWMPLIGSGVFAVLYLALAKRPGVEKRMTELDDDAYWNARFSER